MTTEHAYFNYEHRLEEKLRKKDKGLPTAEDVRGIIPLTAEVEENVEWRNIAKQRWIKIADLTIALRRLCQDYQDKVPVLEIEKILITASEVGEQLPNFASYEELLASNKKVEATTIERCAQVVRELANQRHSANNYYEKLALLEAEAAIRKLKDEEPKELTEKEHDTAMRKFYRRPIAAAEVGEPVNLPFERVPQHATDIGRIHSSGYDIMWEAAVAATIERCARLADDWGLGRVNQTVKDYPATCAAAIAYAIRKLKDEA